MHCTQIQFKEIDVQIIGQAPGSTISSKLCEWFDSRYWIGLLISMNWSMNWSMNRSMELSMDWGMDWCVDWSVDWSMGLD